MRAKVIKDCAPDDPPIPPDADSKVLEGYVRGSLSFIEDDPGSDITSLRKKQTENHSNLKQDPVL